jgi:divalent metal cation (Fe/Co/Zn/Cd) transporter
MPSIPSAQGENLGHHPNNWADWANRMSLRTLLGLLWGLLLFLGVKVSIGWTTHSLSVMAQTLHTLIEAFMVAVSSVALGGVSPKTPRGVHQPATRPLAHGPSQITALGVVFLVALMGFAACLLMILAIQEVRSLILALPSAVTASVDIDRPRFQLLGLVTAMQLCLACFGRYQARCLNNATLRYHANAMVLDVGLMAVVLAALVATRQGAVAVDAVLAMVLLVLALGRGGVLLWQQVPVLVGRGLEPQTVEPAIAPEALLRLVHQVGGITQCSQIRTQGVVGRNLVVEMHLILHPECTGLAPQIADRIDRILQHRFGPAQVIIHIQGDGIYSNN